MRIFTWMAALGIAFGSASPRAQILNESRNPLATVKRLTCVFSASAFGSWKSGRPQADVKSEMISLEVDSIDTEEGTARLTGAEPTFLTVVLAANSLHFMERSLQGNLTVITVFSEADDKGKYRSVRSRHTYLKMAIPGFTAEPAVSQQYGECEAGH
jgi:hypothetical protein